MFFTEEYNNNKILQWALGALIFNYFIVFRYWLQVPHVTKTAFEKLDYVCPAYFQACGEFYFLFAPPFGYSQTFFYMLLFGGLLWAVYLLAEKRWREAQLVLMPYFLWHAFHVLFYSEHYSANYEFYLVGYGIILLFLPHKEFFLKLFLVLLYSLSVAAKIHPAWIQGSYFTNLQLGLPIFPEFSIPFFANLVMLMELVGAWFLFSKNPLLQRSALVFFIAFHLYSGILVQYRYPATVLPMLLIVFGPWFRSQKVPLDRKSILGWVFILCLLLMQLSPKLISGDEKLTLEGNRYGLFMFESNHQCISTEKVYNNEEMVSSYDMVSANARFRCNPYRIWFRLKNLCEHNSSVTRIAWTFDHSINGDPFLRIIDTENVCNLTYHPFKHNEWIKTHEDNPKVIGYPVKNYYE